jgi:hypothetical protein
MWTFFGLIEKSVISCINDAFLLTFSFKNGTLWFSNLKSSKLFLKVAFVFPQWKKGRGHVTKAKGVWGMNFEGLHEMLGLPLSLERSEG